MATNPRPMGYSLSPIRLGPEEIRAAVDKLDKDGYCLLKGLIPKDIAAELAEALLAEHPPMDRDAPAFSLIFGCMSRNDLTWQYCTCHPSAVEVVQHFCGLDITAGEAVCSRLPPGAPAGGLHKDCAQDFVNGHPDTQCCWGVNGIWMLTDFTEENGATHVVPGSHKSPADSSTYSAAPSVPIVGEAGDVFYWHMGVTHRSGGNKTTPGTPPRVGFNSGFGPRWFNTWIMGGHQPLQPRVYERMPPQVRELMPGVTGRTREDVYEYQKAPWTRSDESMAEWALRSGLSPDRVQPLTLQELGSAQELLKRHGYVVLHDRIPSRASVHDQAQAPVADQLADCCRDLSQPSGGFSAQTESLSYGLLNHDSRSWALASHPEVLQLSRHFLGDRCRVVDVISVLTPPFALVAGTGVAAQPHHSARTFGMRLPQPECPWLIEAFWALTECTVLVVPGSHLTRSVPKVDGKAKTTAVEDCTHIKLRPGSVLLAHPGLWQVLAGGSTDGCGVGMRVPNYPTWFNSWLDRNYEPVWPRTFEAMPEVVRAIMPGLRGDRREQLYEFATASQMGGRAAAGASLGVLERHAL